MSEDSLITGLVIYLVVIAGFAVGCGFGARSLMRGKGRSGAAGFCLGFFLGLFGVLIAALLSSTPEHEAQRMRQQMQLMGIAPPPPPGGTGALPPPGLGLGAVPVRTRDRLPLIAWCSLAVGALSLWNTFDFADGMLAVPLAAVAVSAVAVWKRGPAVTGAATGVALSMVGVGLIRVVGNYWSVKYLLFDVGVTVVTVIVLLVKGSSITGLPQWWRSTTFGLGGAAAVTAAVAVLGGPARGVEIPTAIVIVAAPPVVAGLVAASGRRIGLGFALGFGAAVPVFYWMTEFAWFSRGSDTPMLAALSVLCSLGLAGVAGWALSQHSEASDADPHVAAATSATYSPPAPPPPPPPMPMPMSAPPMPMSPPIVPVPSTAAHVAWAPAGAAVSDDVEVTRQRPRPGGEHRLRTSGGEVISVSGHLVLGRAPTRPSHLPTAVLRVVDDTTSSVSRTQCLVALLDGGLWAEDLGSSNGTDVIRGDRTTTLGAGQRLQLAPGDRIELGDVWLDVL